MGERYGLLGFIFVFFLLFFPDSTAASAFSDTKDHWAAQDIAILASKGIVGGYPDGTFRPQEALTRAEFAQLLVSALGLLSEAYALDQQPSPFEDVANNHWALGVINLVEERGLFNGYPGRLFRPQDSIQRQEIAVVLDRLLQLETKERVSGSTFNDASEIAPWAQESVNRMAALGLITGFPDGNFRPREAVTRAEAAALCDRFLVHRGDQFDYYGELKGIDLVGRRLRLVINGEEAILPYAEGLTAWDQGRKMDLVAIKDRLPQKVYFNFNNKKQISLLTLAATKNNIKIDVVPRGYDTASTIPILPGVAKFTEEDPGRRRPGGGFDRLAEGSDDAEGDLASEPGRSMILAKEESGVPAFQQSTGANGSGVLIALIDSGVDPGHPDLQKTLSGKRKIVDWVDFTGEGLVETRGTLPAGQGRYEIAGRTFLLGQIPSASGVYHYGFLREEDLTWDLNFNGNTVDRFLVVLADSKEPGVYDTVYVDTRGDGDLSRVKPLRLFKERGENSAFAAARDGRPVNFVISKLAADGSFVQLSMDLNGHGTHVAGVVAANGRLKGVAPGAQILVIKVLTTNVQADWQTVEEALKYAIEQGANVVNLSLGYYGDRTAGNNSLTQIMAKAAREKGIIFTVAAGNRGPGLSSLATPGNATAAIGVGAYLSPALWKTNYGWEVTHPSLWYFSSSGPREDGLAVPTLVAPGSLVSTAPLWTAKPYYLAEGTSVAAPFVAGGVALLLDAAAQRGLNVDAQRIKQALVGGARQLPNLSPVEAGRGALDLEAAWKRLTRQGRGNAFLTGRIYNRELAFGEGLYAREFIPAYLPFMVTNKGSQSVEVTWRTTSNWLVPEVQKQFLPAEGDRLVPLSYQLPADPGLYTAWLEGVTDHGDQPDVALLATVIKPYSLGPDHKLELQDSLEAAQHRRYFFRVPPGTRRFWARIDLLTGRAGELQGRARLHLVDPQGREMMLSDFAGPDLAGNKQRSYVEVAANFPQAGTWEVVVYSSAALSQLGTQKTKYKLQAGLEGVPSPTLLPPSKLPYYLGLVPKGAVSGQPTYLTLHLRDKQTLRPAEGTVEINGLLYQLENGKATFPVVPSGGQIEVKICL